MSRLGEVIGPAIPVALVTYILTVNVAKAVASKKDLNVSANQEFLALSSSTFLCALFNGALPSGSFSRTALLMLLDVESPLHNVFTALFVVCVCLFMTSLLTLLPMATLAAIIFMALKSMFNVRPAFELWKVSKTEWAQWMVAFLATAILGVTAGILASIIFSVILLLKTSARPPTAVLGVVPGTNIFLPVKRFEHAKEIPGIKLFRFTAALTFANREYFEAQLQKMHYQNVNTTEEIHAVVRAYFFLCGSSLVVLCFFFVLLQSSSSFALECTDLFCFATVFPCLLDCGLLFCNDSGPKCIEIS